MKNVTLAAATCAAVLFTSTQVVAATVVFDGFDGRQITADMPISGAPNTSSQPFGAGERILTVQNFENNGNANAATQLDIVGGRLAFSNDDQAKGMGTVTYTNVGDLTSRAGENGFFLFELGFFDAVAQFMAVATDTMGIVSSYSELLVVGFDPVLFFAQFDGPDGQSNFGSLDTLSFSISTGYEGGLQSVDGSLESIQISAIPLPAGGLLLLTGLGAVSMLRRKKQN